MTEKRGGSFGELHPLVNFIYFAMVIGIAMFSTSPWFIAVSLILSWIYSVTLKGREAIRMNLIVLASLALIMTLINGLFVHKGETVLFYLRDNRITVEAFVFGFAMAMMLVSVIWWFSCFNVIFTGEKLVYLFGRGAPVLGLTVSMILRFIPLLKERYAQIRLGQKCMGRDLKSMSFMGKTRQLLKELSILISWSLEASIETADSMEARGYGLPGRTAFHLFKWSGRDKAVLAALVISGGFAIAGCVLGTSKMLYYPELSLAKPDIITLATLVCYALTAAIPLLLERSRKW